MRSSRLLRLILVAGYFAAAGVLMARIPLRYQILMLIGPFALAVVLVPLLRRR